MGNLVYTPGDEYGEFHALDAATGRLAWSAPVSSYVASAPTVLDGTVYLTVVNTAYALDESTGEVIWSYGTERYPGTGLPGAGGGRRVLPLARPISSRPGRYHG